MSPRSLPLISALFLFVACTSSGDGLGGDGSGGGDPSPGYPGSGGNDDPMPGAVMHCFYGEDDPDTPAATIEHALEVFEEVDSVRVRLTLDPRFVDNTYGAGAIGWGNRGHTFKDLDRSDHAQLQLYDGDGNLTLDFAVDYITAQTSAAAGYASLGIDGGDGNVFAGDGAAILASTTSLDRNLNERGYASFIESSPQTDETYTPDPAAPDWDYRVVYEAWVDLAAFGSVGFGSAAIEYIHASPAKTSNDTIIVDPGECPPEWDPDGDCNDPDGCDNDPNPPDDGDCNDPDGCDNDPNDGDDGTNDPIDPNDPSTGTPDPECVDDSDCPTGEFCGEEGACWPYVE